jgi:glucosamine--fructose-6-phosphate aminotransferase (isomerizing)
VDTSTTWRIGDGTAAFYNYVYYTVAGFSEHDTLRSNQIREGQMSRDEALVRIDDENRPRYPNIKWYLDALGLNFSEVITRVNAIPRLHSR